MAELDFSHHVSEIPAGQQLPNPYQSKESVQITQGPDLQGAISEYAQSTNWKSAIGSYVASKASNAIAQQIGTELGKNPKGDLGIPLTNFDKAMHESYRTQAESTLGLQADKLITESNIEAAKAPRITPEIIKTAQDNIASGLKKIIALAPPEIQPNLEKIYGATQLNQLQHLTNRMIGEQNEDRRNNTILSNNKNAELAHSLASSGNFEQAVNLLKSTESINNSAVAGNIGFTPQQSKVGTDTVRQSVIAGRLQYEYDQKVKENKGDEYLKSLAKRPEWISDADYPSAIQSIRSYANNQQALKSDYEQLTMSQFKEKIDLDVGSITGTELQSTLDKLSPINASRLRIDYINAYKTHSKENEEKTNLILNWQDPTAQANASEKVKNSTFNGKVAYVLKNSPELSREEAENQVAASAGGTIPVFTQTLKNKLWSGDANSMITSAQQIDALQSSGNGHALKGLNEQDIALASDIKHNYNPADPASAARIIIQNKQNQDPEVRKQSEVSFSNMILDNTRKNNTQTDDYVLSTFGMQGGLFHPGFDSPWRKADYASDILNNYRTNFINTGRDNARAVALTKDYIKNNYGKTSINGNSEWALHPIEKACGFNEGEGHSVINKDILRQVSEPMKIQKQLYDEKKSDEYWSIEPVLSDKSTIKLHEAETLSKLLSDKNSHKIQSLNFVRHTRQGVSTNTETYPLRLVGNNFNWELNVQTEDGPRSIFLQAPAIGVHTYTPDIKWIKDNENG